MRNGKADEKFFVETENFIAELSLTFIINDQKLTIYKLDKIKHMLCHKGFPEKNLTFYFFSKMACFLCKIKDTTYGIPFSNKPGGAAMSLGNVIMAALRSP
ncbi:hypothetical protein P5673_021114 [Acropora cervicornis]|uniref:Uncharacterized protein n=1 Tax=Acropora cervicornis TaxID=6130 RepID=A0AAD9Q9K5_ACRCE|nr:hypothetical protein P5673_021114 [Acropora cervicornis]